VRAPGYQHPSWRLHQLVLRIQPSRISHLAVVLVSALRGVQSPEGEGTEISLL
jgi:hypothetical protein